MSVDAHAKARREHKRLLKVQSGGVTCSGCGEQGHTRASMTCPTKLASPAGGARGGAGSDVLPAPEESEGNEESEGSKEEDSLDEMR